MTTFTAVLVAVLLLPLLVLWHLSKTKSQRIQEMRSRGWSWKRCGAYYGVSDKTAKRWMEAA